MSNVTLRIGGRTFTVASDDGEEAHVAQLGRTIDEKLATMGDMAGQSESRMLLFAALLLADELHELRAGVGPAASAGSAPEGFSQRLSAMADRLENLAARLEG